MLGCAPRPMYEKASSISSVGYRARFGRFARAARLAPAARIDRLARFAAAVAVAWAVAGCQPQIGDRCNLNTDCSSSGTRQCDNSMPGGYCTMFNCGPNTCPDQSACYLFNADVQGCTYSDRDPSRTARSFCMKDCAHDSDCRTGYQCADAREAPWNAILLDDNQNQHVCIPIADDAFYDAGTIPTSDLPICQAAPDIDAAFPAPPAIDSGVTDAGADAADASDAGTGPFDAGIDATLDGGADATTGMDAGADAADASDASDDAASDATTD